MELMKIGFTDMVGAEPDLGGVGRRGAVPWVWAAPQRLQTHPDSGVIYSF